jgi:hypothetical protein
MQTGVSMIQQMSQNILNGRPHTIGWTRSQAGTEKHIAANGTKLKRSAPADGLFTKKAPD